MKQAYKRCVSSLNFDKSYLSTQIAQLDVFYPSSVSETNRKPSVLVFFHGGSFIQGSRGSFSDLVHKNLGAFFASRGVITVVPDAHFPNGVEDIRDALSWVVNHVAANDTNRIFCLAHSAGGVHVLSSMLMPPIFLPKFRYCIMFRHR